MLLHNDEKISGGKFAAAKKIFMIIHEKFKTFVGEARRVILQTKLNSDWILNSTLIFHLPSRETLNKIWILMKASCWDDPCHRLHPSSVSNIKGRRNLPCVANVIIVILCIHLFKTTIFISPWRFNSFRQWNEIMQMRIMQIYFIIHKSDAVSLIRNPPLERHREFLWQNLLAAVAAVILLRIQRDISLH